MTFAGSASAQQRLPSRVIPQEVLPLIDPDNRLRLENDLQEQVTVPADSEYIAFVLDTSGSILANVGRQELISRIVGILDQYPYLQGFQVINDLGQYAIGSSSSEWIPFEDSSVEEIIERLQTWNPRSSSNPVGGITEVLYNLATEGQMISIYVIGDDLNSNLSVPDVYESIEHMNRIVASVVRARIHAVVYPTFLREAEAYRSGTNNFITLMHGLAGSSNGTFEIAGLSSLN